MNDSIISYWRDARGAFRSVTALVLTTFIWMQMYPVAAAAKDAIEGNGAGAETTVPASFNYSKASAPSNVDPQRATMEALSKTLNGMHAALKKHRDLIVKRKDKKGNLHITITGTKVDVDLTGARKSITQIKQQLATQDQEAEASFKRDDEHIKAHKLPAVIQQRHDDAVAKYEKNRDAFRNGLDVLGQSQDLNALLSQTDALLKSVADNIPKHAKFDPNNLPFRTADPKVREPVTTPEALRKMLASNQASQKLSKLDVAQRWQEITDTEMAAIEKASKDGETYAIAADPIRVASVGTMSGLLATSAVTPPGPEYLLPTEDVQITPAIQALAAHLHKNPVEIYNWVHDNVEWLPSYGSIQGSQLTLDKKQGNAFDTSSLLIALLRASGIPARYVYGTIDVPAAQINNWVGGTTNTDATQQLLGQGGIPNTGLTKGGQTLAIRLEHVWVEAFVDAYPSRGAKNIAAEAWMPMDASFKQYTYTQGMNLQQSVPFDVGAYLASAQQGATADVTSGFVQNLNQANIQSTFSNYQLQLQNYINNQNPSATVGDIAGAKTIIARQVDVLPSNLSYLVRLVTAPTAALAPALHAKFQYTLYYDENQRALDNSIFQYQTDTVNIAGKKVTLVFVPATDADLQTIKSYLPKPHADGSPIQASEFPTSLPAYQINVNLELRVDGQPVSTGGSFSLGQSLLGEGGFTTMNLQSLDLSEDSLIAGRVSAIGISLQGVSAKEMISDSEHMAATALNIQNRNYSGITADMVSMSAVSSVVHSYFGDVETFAHVASNKAGVVNYPALSYGFAHFDCEPITTYGVATRVIYPGVLMDIGHSRRLAWSTDNTLATWIGFNEVIGQYASITEGETLRESFTDPSSLSSAPKGISAVSALQIAAANGQKIFAISSSNSQLIGSLSQSASVIADVQQAISNGLVVIISQTTVSNNGWTGAGYIIVDPQTGAGSYLIEGGANGGFLLFLIAFVAIALTLSVALIALLEAATIVTVISAAAECGFAVGSFNEFIEALKDIGASRCSAAQSQDILNKFAILFFLDAVTGWGAEKYFANADKVSEVAFQLFGPFLQAGAFAIAGALRDANISTMDQCL